MSIEAHHITRAFGSFVALKDVSLQVGTGELVALLGPSGSGKTTLLRIIAGLETADSGEILFHGQDATDSGVAERRVGFVFQHYALFRHMTVFENIAFGLRVKPRQTRPSREEIRDRVHALLKLVQLDWLADHHPHHLSGGQRQRVALARALAVEPKVLLLDEPFGALDAKVRRELRAWLRRLHDEIHVTSLFVTHDQDEALEVADRVVVMNEGKVEQIGTPDEVYDHPETAFVYQFLGDVNLFHSHVQGGAVSVGDWQVPVPKSSCIASGEAQVYVRPHDIEITKVGSVNNSFTATIESLLVIGPYVRLELKRDGTGERLHAKLSRDQHIALGLAKGERVGVRVKHAKIFACRDDRSPVADRFR
jgi:sulfate transport system ATP-binding protein